MLGRVDHFQACHETPGLGGLEGFIKRCAVMHVEIVRDQDDSLGLWVMHVQQLAHLSGPIGAGVTLRNRDVPPTAKGSVNRKMLAVPWRSYS